MENQINYIPLSADSKMLCDIFEALMYTYIDEMNEHSHRPLPKEFQKKWIDSIISMQGPQDRHLELCYLDGKAIGFLYGKVDHEDHKGYIRPGWGYIMEFYIRPEYRRKRLGSQMFNKLESLFRQDGVAFMYLTADPVTGKPFWEAMGFTCTGERSPENNLLLYEKAVSGYPGSN